MNNIDFVKLVKDIVQQAKSLKDRYTEQSDAPVNYASDIFFRSSRG